MALPPGTKLGPYEIQLPLGAGGMGEVFAKTIGAAHGSFASNQPDAASDIDVLVIGSPRAEDLARAVRALERRLGREINYAVLTPKQFGSRRARKDAFLENVWHNERIPLVGSDEETKATHYLNVIRTHIAARKALNWNLCPSLPQPSRIGSSRSG
jgi:predicted nucleotidyltransferase